MTRRAGIALLAASLIAVPLFDIMGPLAPFTSWGLAVGGFVALRHETKSASKLGLAVLAACILASVTFTGIVLGALGRPFFHSARLDPTPVAEALGFVAAWLATGAFLIMAERKRHGKLAIVAMAFLALAAYAYIWDELARVGVRLQPSFGLEGAAMTGAILAGVALLTASFARFAFSGTFDQPTLP